VLGLAVAANGLVGLAIGLLGLADLRPLRPGEVAFIAGWTAVCSLGPNDVLKSVLTERLWTSRRRAA